MRLERLLVETLLVAASIAIGSVTSFAPSLKFPTLRLASASSCLPTSTQPKTGGSPSALGSTVRERAPVQVEQAGEGAIPKSSSSSPSSSPLLFGEEINIRLEAQLEKLRARDEKSRAPTKDELNVVYEDESIVVIDKPAGVLSVPTRHVKDASLSEAVYKAFGCDDNSNMTADRMVVHRLAMDSSGVMVFCKTKKALRGMNKGFQTRTVTREYEALVCGHLVRNVGVVDLPIMRDYERPPFMRISTEEHQRKLMDLEAEIVGKKILEMPKESITKYRVLAREELDGQPVTRVALTSVSGRTHQLNVHMAAIGHPIVGDKIYGYGGDALPNGGLTVDEMRQVSPSSDIPNDEMLKQIAVLGKPTCIHAKSIGFRHPVHKKLVSFETDAPF